jgi:hypothetical protein
VAETTLYILTLVLLWNFFLQKALHGEEKTSTEFERQV